MIITALATAAVLAAGTIYPSTMTVTGITSQVVTMETSTGHVYEMYGPEDYMVGDMVSAIMYDMGTKDVRDDIILDARYSGYFFKNEGRNGPVLEDL